MKYVIDFIKRKWFISGLVFVAFATIILYQATANIPDACPPWGELAFSSSVKFSYSYLASIIFYILVTYAPSVKDKQRAYKYTKIQVRSIILTRDQVIENLIKCGTKFWQQVDQKPVNINGKNISKDDIYFLCQLVKANGPSGSFLGLKALREQREATWSEYLVLAITKTQEEIEKVTRNAIYIEFTLLEILNKLESCELFRMKQFISDLQAWDQDLLCLNEALYEYHGFINQIEEYNQKTILNEQ